MSGEPILTVVGNLTADPELRFTPSGAAVANFTVACTPRTFERQSNEWKDGETLFQRCNIWKDAAENVAESLHRGDRVVVQGRLKSRSYETKEGEKRTSIELEVDEVGPSLRYASARVTKAERRGAGQQQQGGQQWPQGQQQHDPWSTGPGATPQPQGGPPQGPPQQGNPNQNPPANPNQGQGGWQQPPAYDEPPF